jgi:drug/metabolite transporter (DMT)-like permease
MTHTGTSGLVVGAVLVSAVLHATWNATAHAITDRFLGFTLIGLTCTVGGALLAAFSPLPAAAAWAFVLASATMHVLYNLFLMWSYRLGHFGRAYPLARGMSPWLVAIAAFLFAGEALPATRLAGVLVISAGLALLVLAGGRPGRADRPAISAAVLTGVFIAVYTTLDGLGVRRSGTTTGYVGWLFLLQGPAFPVAALATRGRRLVEQARPHLVAGVAAGALSLLAYGLVLWAQRRGALAPIAALRETGVIIGAGIAAVRFREPFGRWRILAATLVALGVILISR